MNNPVFTSKSEQESSEILPEVILQAEDVSVSYHGIPALQNISLEIYKNQITSFIGPSGCGKSTFLRCFNRLNDLIPETRMTGKIRFFGQSIRRMNPVEIRRRIGMVFQRPNPFPKSIYDNIAVGLRVNGYRGNLDDRVETSLRHVGLWNEVKNKLKKNALDLSGGQQQRLCIARTIALNPEVILMDEPTAALDPISAGRINDLLMTMRQYYTIILITHNLKQAALVTDRVAFFNVEINSRGDRVGKLIEYAPTLDIFVNPTQQTTWDYVVPGSRYSS
ncbi:MULTISPECIES: phosphate ABC transporter ATP-binding protein [Spirulina sp. CCY15215]|uniref:phosphate ABC transporter ATP-binding protein n=1 Tax=Spirulina sp. CCY15215 TaxID=2767591 RepID=UPI0032AEF30C